MDFPKLIGSGLASAAGAYSDMSLHVRWPDFWLRTEDCQVKFVYFLSWFGLPGIRRFWWIPCIQNRVARIRYQRMSLGNQIVVAGMSGVAFLVASLIKKDVQLSNEAKG